MRALVVVLLDEGIEARLLLQQIRHRRLGGLLLEGEMHALVPAVLLGMTGSDALDASASRSHQTASVLRPSRACADANGTPLSVQSPRQPEALKVRSKTANAYASRWSKALRT